MKKIHRFLLKEIPSGKSINIDNAEIVHLIKNVLKLNIGEECIVFSDGGDDRLCSIKSIEKKSVQLEVNSIIPKKVATKKVTACISITKRDNFELVVQKLTELGVKTIIPIISDRTIKQALRSDRLQKISDEALEQSGGSDRVHITETETLEASLMQRKVLCSCYFDIEGQKYSALPSDNELVFYIGPEGGWSDEDKSLFSKYKVPALTLGDTVLRAETAAIVCGYKLLWD